MTTVSHLVLEGPSFFVFVAAAVRGSDQAKHGEEMCIINVIVIQLAILNATVPFYLYYACNDKFRTLAGNVMIGRRREGCHSEVGSREPLESRGFSTPPPTPRPTQSSTSGNGVRRPLRRHEDIRRWLLDKSLESLNHQEEQSGYNSFELIASSVASRQ